MDGAGRLLGWRWLDWRSSHLKYRSRLLGRSWLGLRDSQNGWSCLEWWNEKSRLGLPTNVRGHLEALLPA